MYEDVTYELILDRMLDRVLAQNPNIDTREGSIIYNALAPAAVELQNMYIQLDTILNESFADTQTRDYLIKRCAERGVSSSALLSVFPHPQVQQQFLQLLLRAKTLQKRASTLL